jgi:hypothetical protein
MATFRKEDVGKENPLDGMFHGERANRRQHANGDDSVVHDFQSPTLAKGTGRGNFRSPVACCEDRAKSTVQTASFRSFSRFVPNGFSGHRYDGGDLTVRVAPVLTVD